MPKQAKGEFAGRLRRSEWEVRALSTKTDLGLAQEMVARLHYARGGSKTATDLHGLYRVGGEICQGVAWWLPPTKPAALSVHQDWRRVVALSRFVIEPGVPKNAATFLLSRAVRTLKREGRWAALVTYADEAVGHLGYIYRAANWTYVGRTGPYTRWVDGEGRQRAAYAARNRRKAEMEALGFKIDGRFYKHKYTYMLEPVA